MQAWIDNVAYAHSKSSCTESNYRHFLKQFCTFIDKTPQQIVDDYEAMTDRDFRRRYAQYLRAFIADMAKNGYAASTVSITVAGLKSFFKYNDLPLAFVPVGRCKVVYHNRDITKAEIEHILKVSKPRDRAFFCMMAQSGLRPDTLANLRIKHIEPEFSKGFYPCKIEVTEDISKGEFGAYFTFIGKASIEHLQAYLATRGNLGPEDRLFTLQGSDKKLNTKSMAGIFSRAIEKLKEKGLMDFEQKAYGKPRTVRLYNLRKYFRKKAGHQVPIEYVNFWMGHKTNYQAPHIPASDVHYFSREDVEFHREVYKKATPDLRLETATPGETEQTIKKLEQEMEELRQENLELKKKLNGFTLSGDQVAELLKRIEALEKLAQKQK